MCLKFVNMRKHAFLHSFFTRNMMLTTSAGPFPGEQACDSPAVPVGHLPPKSLDLQSDLAGRVDIPCSWIVIIPNILNI